MKREKLRRNIILYTLASLLMTLMVSFMGALLPLFFLMQQAESDPELKKTMEEIAQQHSVEWDLDETEIAKRREALAPLYTRLNWFQIGLLTSLLVFPALGFFITVLGGDPRGLVCCRFLAFCCRTTLPPFPTSWSTTVLTGSDCP